MAAALALPAPTTGQDAPLRRYQSPGGSWSVELPADLPVLDYPDQDATTEMAVFPWPPRPEMAGDIAVVHPRLPLGLMVSRVAARDALNGARIVRESRVLLGGFPAWRADYVSTNAGGAQVRTVTIIVDTGTRSVWINFSAAAPYSPQATRLLDGLLVSLQVSRAPLAPRPFEAEVREIPDTGLKLPLPKGGETHEEPADLTMIWPRHGIGFGAAWRRTSLTPLEAASGGLSTAHFEGGLGCSREVVEVTASEIGDESCARVRGYTRYEDQRFCTWSMIVRRSGPGELLAYGFCRYAEVPLEELSALEELAVQAKAAARLGAPATEPPSLSVTVRIWLGRAQVRVPEGWHGIQRGRHVAEGEAFALHQWKALGEEKCPDLAVVAMTGKLAGGMEPFNRWVQAGLRASRSHVVAGSAAPVSVGGRPGFSWQVEYGPPGDRWALNVVAVFHGDRFDALLSECPVILSPVYGGLAERVAETVSWTK